MSKRRNKTKPETVTPRQELVVLNSQLPQQDLEKKNRFLLTITFTLAVVVFVLSSFLLPAHDMVEDLKEKQTVQVATVEENLKNPVVSDEIDKLRGQLVGLVSGSIESKLNSLEKSIKLGSVLGSLETVRSVKEDLKVLKSYSDPLEQKKQQAEVANETLVKEVSQLKNLIYLTLGSSGLMFAALAGIWIKGRKRLLPQAPGYLEKKNGSGCL